MLASTHAYVGSFGDGDGGGSGGGGLWGLLWRHRRRNDDGRTDIANFNSNRNRRTFFRDAMVAAAGGSLLSTQVGFPNRASASGGATAGKYT